MLFHWISYASVQVLLLTLLAVSNAEFDGTDGLYQFELCGGRSSCAAGPPQFIGFNNMTCDENTYPEYGPTVGPVLRSSVDQMWTWWRVSILQNSSVTIMNAYPFPGAGTPRCLDYYMTGYAYYRDKPACVDDVWAERVHLHDYARAYDIVPVSGTDCYNIINVAKPDQCWRFLSATADCDNEYLKFVASDDGSGLQRWRIRKFVPLSPPPVNSVPPQPSRTLPPPRLPPPRSPRTPSPRSPRSPTSLRTPPSPPRTRSPPPRSPSLLSPPAKVLSQPPPLLRSPPPSPRLLRPPPPSKPVPSGTSPPPGARASSPPPPFRRPPRSPSPRPVPSPPTSQPPLLRSPPPRPPPPRSPVSRKPPPPLKPVPSGTPPPPRSRTSSPPPPRTRSPRPPPPRTPSPPPPPPPKSPSFSPPPPVPACSTDSDCQVNALGEWICNGGSCQCPGVICPQDSANPGSCVQNSLLCIVSSSGTCTVEGALCEPSSGGIIKVCGSNNNCVSCSGTNHCPTTPLGDKGDSNYFTCESGGCTRSCTTIKDCAPMGLVCRNGICDIP